MTIDIGWRSKHIPSQSGKTVIVTGANSGIGFTTALELGKAGAYVIVAVRNTKKGNAAVAQFQRQCPQGQWEVLELDTSQLRSVHSFCMNFMNRSPSIKVDLLVLNAGIMMLPTHQLSADGFELQLATNYLGHFALTTQLLPALLRSPCPRVVTVSSIMAWPAPLFSALNKDPLFSNWVKTPESYSPRGTYAESKFACYLFAKELGRRFPSITSVSAHPGASLTNLHQHAFQQVLWAMQSPEKGALSILRASTEPKLPSGSYIGPLLVIVGPPTSVGPHPRGWEDNLGTRLWESSQKAVTKTVQSKL